jgi:hypothetical protein
VIELISLMGFCDFCLGVEFEGLKMMGCG